MQHPDLPGTIILDYSADAVEPRVLWRWIDMGNELRDEGDGTFDELIRRRRETDFRLP